MAAIPKLKQLPPEVNIEAEFILTRELLVRVWLASQLFRLGAWILGSQIEIEKTVNGR